MIQQNPLQSIYPKETNEFEEMMIFFTCSGREQCWNIQVLSGVLEVGEGASLRFSPGTQVMWGSMCLPALALVS